jgi:hypothetical protein
MIQIKSSLHYNNQLILDAIYRDGERLGATNSKIQNYISYPVNGEVVRGSRYKNYNEMRNVIITGINI